MCREQSLEGMCYAHIGTTISKTTVSDPREWQSTDLLRLGGMTVSSSGLSVNVNSV